MASHVIAHTVRFVCGLVCSTVQEVHRQLLEELAIARAFQRGLDNAENTRNTRRNGESDDGMEIRK